jgi:ribosomal protein L24
MQARALGTQAGIIEMEAALHWSNVAVVCPDCDRATRVAWTNGRPPPQTAIPHRRRPQTA